MCKIGAYKKYIFKKITRIIIHNIKLLNIVDMKNKYNKVL